MRTALLICSLLLGAMLSSAQAPKPFGALPNARQLAWHERPLYGFVHFTLNTFTGKEWGYGDESPALFNPTDFDADQIVRTFKEAGLQGLILTAKHHDGFCLWPSAFTEHSVKHAPWKDGKGDVVKELSEACRRQGLAFGIYLSPWDRNHQDYGKPAYVAYYRNQLRELLTQYGPIFEVWFDGANGGDGWYGGARDTRTIDRKTYYGWEETWALARQLQPGAVIFSDAGPDVRWVGTERGFAGDPCWATLNREGLAPGLADEAQLLSGHRNGRAWVPAEVDLSIRPGWFYHAAEDGQVLTPQRLFQHWFESVGRGASLLLNVPPDGRGRIHERDVAALRGFRQLMDQTFSRDLARGASATASQVRGGDLKRFGPHHLIDGKGDTYWATDDAITTPEVILSFQQPVRFNIVRLKEFLPLGQRVDDWAMDTWQDGAWKPFASGKAIGACRLVRGSHVSTTKVRLRITKAAACPALAELALFAEPEQITAH